MSWTLALPVLIPLATAAAALVATPWPLTQRWIGVAGAAAHLAAATQLLRRVSGVGILVTEAGGWPAPFGIALVADHMGALMVTVGAIIGAATAVYSLGDIDARRAARGHYPLLHVLLAGVSGSFLTGDLFNLYVWFEVMLVASFVLIAHGGARAQLDGAVKYVASNFFSSLLFLIAAGILFGMTGTLNLADVAVRLAEVDAAGPINAVAMVLLVAFGIKAAVFPLFLWLPASYHTPPIAVAAVFAGLLTKVGVYALIRVFTLVFTPETIDGHALLLWISGLTMVSGVLGAAAQDDVRRILAFHIISQVGFMVMGLALRTPLALLGSIFYIVHHILVKTNLFLIAGIMNRVGGSFDLARPAGLYRSHPALAIVFVIPAFSLAGMPPLSGFWAKLILVRAGLDVGAYAIVATALLVGLVTLFSMTKIWGAAFWQEPEEATTGSPPGPGPARATALVAPAVALTALTLATGLWAQPLYHLAERAADELLDPARYIEAVLGGRG